MIVLFVALLTTEFVCCQGNGYTHKLQVHLSVPDKYLHTGLDVTTCLQYVKRHVTAALLQSALYD